jgi:hypothetical protein
MLGIEELMNANPRIRRALGSGDCTLFFMFLPCIGRKEVQLLPEVGLLG